MPENEDEFTVNALYSLLCRRTSSETSVPKRQNIVSEYRRSAKTSTIFRAEFIAPDRIDFTHGKYICVTALPFLSADTFLWVQVAFLPDG